MQSHVQQQHALISEEIIEDIRMATGFDRKEIVRLCKKFYELTEEQEFMTRPIFLSISCIDASPLKHQVASIFGFSDYNNVISIKQFVVGVAKFNCPLIESREEKMRVAFRLQDIDGDGIISKIDIINYLDIVTSKKLENFELEEIANNMLQESAYSDSLRQQITFQDFQRVIAGTDFQTKLRLPI